MGLLQIGGWANQQGVNRLGSPPVVAGAAAAPAGPASREVDDASVSGQLYYWFKEEGLEVSVPGTSGLGNWNDSSQTQETAAKRNNSPNEPKVASGVDGINGLDTAYCLDAASDWCFFETTPVGGDVGITQFQGTNKPFTFFCVFEAHQTTAFQNVFSLCKYTDNNDGQRQFFVHSEGRLGYFERDDVNVDWRNIGGQSSDLDNKVAVNTPSLMTFATSADGTTIRGWKNNVEWTISPSGLEIGGCSPIDLGIGVNADSNLDSVFTGKIGEIVMYASGMTQTEVEEVGQGLMTKWAITA